MPRVLSMWSTSNGGVVVPQCWQVPWSLVKMRLRVVVVTCLSLLFFHAIMSPVLYPRMSKPPAPCVVWGFVCIEHITRRRVDHSTCVNTMLVTVTCDPCEHLTKEVFGLGTVVGDTNVSPRSPCVEVLARNMDSPLSQFVDDALC